MAITKAARKHNEKRKNEANPDNAFDVRNFPDKLRRTGPDEITNTMHRLLSIGAGGPEKKRLFSLFEHWLKILDKAMKTNRHDEREDLIGHGQELVTPRNQRQLAGKTGYSTPGPSGSEISKRRLRNGSGDVGDEGSQADRAKRRARNGSEKIRGNMLRMRKTRTSTERLQKHRGARN